MAGFDAVLDRLPVSGGVDAKVGALAEVLAEHLVVVLIAPTLPGVSGWAKKTTWSITALMVACSDSSESGFRDGERRMGSSRAVHDDYCHVWTHRRGGEPAVASATTLRMASGGRFPPDCFLRCTAARTSLIQDDGR